MELWILLALGAPFFWACSNVIDQFLVRDSFEKSPASFIFYQGFFYLPYMVAILLVRPEVLQVPLHDILIAFAFSPTIIIGCWLYLKALKRDDASIAVPLFNMVTFMTLILAWVILGEVVTFPQVAMGCLIILGAVLLMWDFKAGKLRGITFMLMLGACLAYAIYAVFARKFTGHLHWIDVYFWFGVGEFLISTTGAVLYPKARKLFVHTIKTETPKTLGLLGFLMLIAAGFDFVAVMMVTAAYSMGTGAGLVAFFASVQPLYIVIMAGVLGWFFPKYYHALKWDGALLWKVICISIMLIGVYLLSMNANIHVG